MKNVLQHLNIVLLTLSLGLTKAILDPFMINYIKEKLLDDGKCMLFIMGDLSGQNETADQRNVFNELYKDQVMFLKSDTLFKILPYTQNYQVKWSFSFHGIGYLNDYVYDFQRFIGSTSSKILCAAILPLNMEHLRKVFQVNNPQIINGVFKLFTLLGGIYKKFVITLKSVDNDREILAKFRIPVITLQGSYVSLGLLYTGCAKVNGQNKISNMETTVQFIAYRLSNTLYRHGSSSSSCSTS